MGRFFNKKLIYHANAVLQIFIFSKWFFALQEVYANSLNILDSILYWKQKAKKYFLDTSKGDMHVNKS
jgi:hypothetical protein